MSAPHRVDNVTCLGCGCSCDDVSVRVEDNRIVGVDPACPTGRAWFGDGQVPSGILSNGQAVSLEQALTELVDTLVAASGHCLVYLGSDLTIEAQRAAVTLADLLKATVDSETSDTAAHGLTVAQRRGRAGATLGEIRNRGDVFLFWGVDPNQRYPRFLARYSLEPAGTQVPEGRAGRLVMSVSIGADRSLAPADFTLALAPDQEIVVLSLIRAAVLGNRVGSDSAVGSSALQIAERLSRGRYTVLVHDAEPTSLQRNPLRVEALIALAQALNGPTRAALVSLRAGGNQVGAESMLTWQTGYPFAVDYALGYPEYRPDQRATSRLPAGRYRAALIVGRLSPENGRPQAFSELRPAMIGPRATEAPFPTSLAIDTGVAGIHDGGTAYRMDEVPLTLRPSVEGPRSAVDVLQALAAAIHRRLRAGAP
jgi:formylmethanofuran dehydrogenase subunit B